MESSHSTKSSPFIGLGLVFWDLEHGSHQLMWPAQWYWLDVFLSQGSSKAHVHSPLIDAFMITYIQYFSSSMRPVPTCSRTWAYGWNMLLKTNSRSIWRVWACSSSRRTSDPNVCPCAAPCCRASLRPWLCQTPLTTAGPSSAPPQKKSSTSCPIKSRYKICVFTFRSHLFTTQIFFLGRQTQ